MLNGKLECAQLDIIGVLNGMLGAQQAIIMCSTGHYWCAQLDVIGVLNGKLGAQWEVMCSMGNYNVLNWILLECSMGCYVLNGKL